MALLVTEHTRLKRLRKICYCKSSISFFVLHTCLLVQPINVISAGISRLETASDPDGPTLYAVTELVSPQ